MTEHLDDLKEMKIEKAPADLSAICDRWNKRAQRAGDVGYRATLFRVIRPSGRANYHLRLRIPSGQHHSASLGGEINELTIHSAIKLALRRFAVKVAFDF
jgi:hypothetical protein